MGKREYFPAMKEYHLSKIGVEKNSRNFIQSIQIKIQGQWEKSKNKFGDLIQIARIIK